MEKIIWVIENGRVNALDVQRKINARGSMKAVCMLTEEALNNKLKTEGEIMPSLIVVGENMAYLLERIVGEKSLTGTPVFVMSEIRNEELADSCYDKGAIAVLNVPLTESSVRRIENTASQYEMGRQYERVLQKQQNDLQTAKEIYNLNQQLEARNKFLYRIFGKYFSDDVLEMILETPEGATIGGEKKEFAVLMSDLRGFSAMSEELTPETLTDILNYYFGTMVEIVGKYKGTVIEFMGDGILAVFGAPIYNDNYRENAICAAIEMQNAMHPVNKYARDKGVCRLSMGIGIHCGNAFIGNVGSEKMMRYNVLGSMVNVCSRIEGCSVGGQVLVSEAMVNQMDTEIQIENEFEISVKGLELPLKIFRVRGMDGEYNCKLKSHKVYEMADVINETFVTMYTIDEKIMSEEALTGRMTAVSDTRVRIEGCVIPVFSDVCINGFAGEKNIFKNAYAKVLEVEENAVVLHFTRVNKELEEFISMYVK